jgi:protein SCO1/2
LVYFGYTFCPDICPTGLQAMAEALDLLGPAGRRVQPLFITVDPARDTTEVLADYVDAFHPRLIGLTGTAAEVKAVAAAYRVRYFKLFYPWSGEEKDEKGKAIPEYAMYHTAFTYLMGPDGSGLAVFPHGAFPEDMAAEIRRALEAKI